MYFNHVVDSPMQSQEKEVHIEHSFCLQTTIGGIVCCVPCRGHSVGTQLLSSLLKRPDCSRGRKFVISQPVLILLNVTWMNEDQVVWVYRLGRLSWGNEQSFADMIDVAWHSYVTSRDLRNLPLTNSMWQLDGAPIDMLAAEICSLSLMNAIGFPTKGPTLFQSQYRKCYLILKVQYFFIILKILFGIILNTF